MRLHTRNILAAALLAFPFASVAQAQESFLGIVGGDAWKVNIVSDSGKYAELKGVIDIESAPEIAPQHSSCILPVLETADRTYSYAFSPIYVDTDAYAQMQSTDWLCFPECRDRRTAS
ncbi:MAG: hypothetical protein BHV78_07830 [Bacteroides sp. CAG:1060_57_27]|nr:MAG: hypothetical protein BHV78_07830 [Bacteroides sp. CAG:1060_57_27]